MVTVVVDKPRFCTFRLSGGVGFGQPNALDDIEFVRFGLSCLRKQLLGVGKVSVPRYSDFFMATVSLPMTGGMDQGLDRAIRGFQTSQDLKVDGIVSASTLRIAPSGKNYTHSYLDFAMRAMHPRLYPRIDLVPESGPAVSKAITGIFVVDSPSDKMQIK